MAKKRTEYSAEELERMTPEELEKLLPDKQQLFVREYMVDRNGTQAAIRAGYRAGKDNHAAAVQAARLMKDPVIRAYRLARQREAFANLDITLESLCADLAEIKERCMQGKPVKVWNYETRQYEETGEWAFDAKGAEQAIARLSELLGIKERQRSAETVKVEMVEAYAD